MIGLLDTSQDLDVCSAELGAPVEQLFSPLTRFRDRHPDRRKAADNSGFKVFQRTAYEALLEREYHQRDMFRFVTVPDIVASARRTLELFDYWYPRVCMWPLALVAQDGQEDLPIPWELIQAVFIGGTDGFKDGRHAVDIIKTAKAMGKWTHVGRVNDPVRWSHFENLGVDSVDGTGIAQYSHMRIAIRDREEDKQHGLFTQEQITPYEADRPQEMVDVVA